MMRNSHRIVTVLCLCLVAAAALSWTGLIDPPPTPQPPPLDLVAGYGVFKLVGYYLQGFWPFIFLLLFFSFTIASLLLLFVRK